MRIILRFAVSYWGLRGGLIGLKNPIFSTQGRRKTTKTQNKPYEENLTRETSATDNAARADTTSPKRKHSPANTTNARASMSGSVVPAKPSAKPLFSQRAATASIDRTDGGAQSSLI